MLTGMSLFTPPRPTVGELDDDIEVLYLEDDPDLAEMYRLKLQLDGYHVRIVPLDSTPAAQIPGPTPELLFVDIRSSVRRGMASLDAWRNDPRFSQTPAVIMSNVTASKLGESGLRLSPMDELIVIADPLRRH